MANRTDITFQHQPEHGLVSVIVPTYNRAPIVGRAIQSALRQSYSHVEVIVVDDGSVDDTEHVVRGFGERVRYIRQQNAGVSAARNTGMAHARGEFVAFLDSDDAWLEWKLEAEIAAFRAHPEVGLVWTDMTAIDVAGRVAHDRYLRMSYDAYRELDFDAMTRVVGTLSDLIANPPPLLASAPLRLGDLSSAIILGNLLHTSTVVIRKSWVEAVGGMHTTWKTGEDYEYYTRICSLGLVMLIDAPSVLYRIGAEDQLTAPPKLLLLAQNNLRTVRARLADRADRITLPPSTVRRRVASSLAWVGNMEFEVGHHGAAARHLFSSIWHQPNLDRRVVLLACCALPRTAIDGLRAMKQRNRAKHDAA